MSTNQTTTSTVQRTTSADGTAIAYEAYGSGPAAVIVGGAFCDRGAFRDVRGRRKRGRMCSASISANDLPVYCMRDVGRA